MLQTALIISTIFLAAIAIALAVIFQQKLKQNKQTNDKQQDQAICELNSRLDHFSQSINTDLNQITTSVLEQLSRSTSDFNARLGEQGKILRDSHKTMGERLGEHSKILGDRLDNVARVTTQVTGYFSKLEESSKRIMEVGASVAELQNILKAPKLRGGMGEFLLENILREILPAEMYSLQYSFKNNECVDAIIKFPNQGYLLPVDSKFPLENFKKITAANMEAEKQQYFKLLVGDIKKHIRDIATKYIRPEEGTFDLAFMYIPAENIYYQLFVAGMQNFGLTDFAFKNRVIPISPNSFYSYLQIIILGLRGWQIEKGAKEIYKNIQKIKFDFAKFGDDFQKIGKHIHNAEASYENTERRFTKLNDKIDNIIEHSGAGVVAIDTAEKVDRIEVAGQTKLME